MKSLRKSFLTLLALTLFGGAGAWAQGPTAAELTIPASWNNDQTPITAAGLPGFVAVDSATADQWVDASTTGHAMLIYGFTTDGEAKHIIIDPGLKLWGTALFDRNSVYGNRYLHSSVQVFYTTGGGAIELTKSGANQWTLGQTPDYDLELQVEYYEAHALKDIPAGWTVMVNGNPATVTRPGDSLMIVETDSVTLVPAGNPRRVKSVTLEDEGTPVESITLNKTTTTIYKVSGTATETLSVTSVLPEEATDKTYTWSSDNTAAATVDENGVVTAVAEGTAHIRATANDGSGVYGECTVTVSDLSAYYSKMVECGCGDLDGKCANGANPESPFTKQVLTAAQAIALAQAKAAETSSNCAVFYGNGSDLGEIVFAKSDGTTGSAQFYYTAGDKGLSGYRGFYVNNN